MTEKRDPIAACIVCRNEANKLGPCLESVQWADEVLVLDLESGDGSAAVARAHGARVVSHARVPVVELVRNRIAAEAGGDWILALDPDERVSPGLARTLRELSGRDDLDAIVLPRMNVDFGYAPASPLHRYEPQLRMYRRSRVQWPTFPNALPEVAEDRLHRVPPRDDLVLIHERSATVVEVVDRVLRYAPAQGRAMAAAGEEFTARRMLASLRQKTWKEFVHGEPWRDGVPGMMRAGLLVAFRFYVWLAFWEASGAPRTHADDDAIRRVGRAIRVARALAVLGGRTNRLVALRRRRT